MELVEADDFLAWAADGGIGPDPQGGSGPLLAFTNAARAVRRWSTPEAPFNLPGFA